MGGWAWLGVAVGLWLLGVDALPEVYVRLSPRTLRRGPAGRGRVALTFDDGPDPEATPQVLDVLRRLGVRATFFVVVARARRHPELVARMRAEGHEVALHGLVHRHAWLMTPWGSASALRRADRELAERLGAPSPYFRPPWGAANLGYLWAARRLGRRFCLWTVAPGDWRRDLTPEVLASRVASQCKDGDIVDLHDAGGAPGAPQRTRDALPAMVEGLRARGLEPVRLADLLDQGEEPVTWAIRLWEVWEQGFARAGHLVPIGREGLFSIGIRPYRGPRLRSALGEEIRSGDLAGEIHLGNYVISRMGGEVREAFRLRRRLNAAMDELAQRVADGAFPGVKVFFGTTLLGRAARHVGLHSEELPLTLGVRLNRLYMTLLLRIYQPRGRPQAPEPSLCWVSRGELLVRHRRRVASAALEPGLEVRSGTGDAAEDNQGPAGG